MKKFGSPRKTKFISEFPENSLSDSDIRSRCKFNFSFFDDSQPHGSGFHELEAGVLADILLKIKSFTRNDLNYWRNERCGAHSLKVYADYKSFPARSEFKFPKAIPHDVNWGRFRLENLSRLIGFTIPGTFRPHETTDHFSYDFNTFYVVFIDLEHKFYLSEKR